MTHHSCPFGLYGLGAFILSATCATHAVAGIQLRDIQVREASSTAFANLEAGVQVPAGTVSGAVFTAPGTVVFMQSPPFYLEDSNRAWSFTNEGSAIIKLPDDVVSVTIAARGSADGDTLGPIFGKAPLAEAKGAIHALDEQGRRIRSVKLANVSLRGDDARLISFKGGATVKGPRMVAIELENRSKADHSVVVIGGIGLTRSRAATGAADTNQDGFVDLADLADVLQAIGSDNARQDVNGDGSVTVDDLAAAMERLGTCD